LFLFSVPPQQFCRRVYYRPQTGDGYKRLIKSNCFNSVGALNSRVPRDTNGFRSGDIDRQTTIDEIRIIIIIKIMLSSYRDCVITRYARGRGGVDRGTRPTSLRESRCAAITTWRHTDWFTFTTAPWKYKLSEKFDK